jgi:hypothetical protein
MPRPRFEPAISTFERPKTVLALDRSAIEIGLNIVYEEKYIEESINTNFFGLQIDNHLNWKIHIDLMIPMLS